MTKLEDKYNIKNNLTHVKINCSVEEERQYIWVDMESIKTTWYPTSTNIESMSSPFGESSRKHKMNCPICKKELILKISQYTVASLPANDMRGENANAVRRILKNLWTHKYIFFPIRPGMVRTVYLCILPLVLP